MAKIYEIPVQVYFTIKVDHEPHYGIAFGEWVISAYNGNFFTFDEVDILKEFIDWVDFTESIRE